MQPYTPIASNPTDSSVFLRKFVTMCRTRNCHSEYGNEAWSSGSESPCCFSTLSSEHESTSGTTLTGSGLPMRKKRKIRSGPGGKFKASWKLPQFLACITDLVLKILKFDEVIPILSCWS